VIEKGTKGDEVVLSQDATYGNGDDRVITQFLHNGALAQVTLLSLHCSGSVPRI
jgi:hypothetical protein